MAGQDLLKWDVRPFISHKRASMPNCSLVQLKDAILKGTHPYAAYLFEHSGLVHTNDQHVNAPLAGNSISLPAENKNRMVRSDSCIRNLLPFKRNKSGLIDKSSAGDCQEDEGCIRDCHIHVNAKRSKSDVSFTDPLDKMGASLEHHCGEGASDLNQYHHYVAMKKSQFLGSRCTIRQDSLAAKQNLCVICGKDGQVLTCSAVGCPLVFHEECLGSLSRFVDKGDFYCPFCAYSRVAPWYAEAKKKSSLARKDLTAFIHHSNEGNRGQPCKVNKQPV